MHPRGPLPKLSNVRGGRPVILLNGREYDRVVELAVGPKKRKNRVDKLRWRGLLSFFHWLRCRRARRNAAAYRVPARSTSNLLSRQHRSRNRSARSWRACMPGQRSAPWQRPTQCLPDRWLRIGTSPKWTPDHLAGPNICGSHRSALGHEAARSAGRVHGHARPPVPAAFGTARLHAHGMALSGWPPSTLRDDNSNDVARRSPGAIAASTPRHVAKIPRGGTLPCTPVSAFGY